MNNERKSELNRVATGYYNAVGVVDYLIERLNALGDSEASRDEVAACLEDADGALLLAAVMHGYVMEAAERALNETEPSMILYGLLYAVTQGSAPQIAGDPTIRWDDNARRVFDDIAAVVTRINGPDANEEVECPACSTVLP